MDTCIYIGPDLQLLPQMVNVWVDALSSQKKNKGYIISSLHVVWTIFVSIFSMCCVRNLLEDVSLKK